MADSSRPPTLQNFSQFGCQYPSQGGDHQINFTETGPLRSEFHPAGVTDYRWDHNDDYIMPLVDGSTNLPDISRPEDVQGAYESLLKFTTENELTIVCLY